MAIFNGRYRWDGTKRGEYEPIAWSPGAYDLKIFKCSSSSEKVQHLKPFICIYAPTGEGQSISANPEKFAKQICNDFSLDLERVLWIEDLLTEENRYEVIMFTRSAKIGKTTFYRTDKRMALEREVLMIQQEISRLEATVE
ncbi:MAG: hypothetical protein GQ542_08105 [Desulforhopalus sp.]|nr:hypothetical protein [Desulforhopalus sp.]